MSDTVTVTIPVNDVLPLRAVYALATENAAHRREIAEKATERRKKSLTEKATAAQELADAVMHVLDQISVEYVNPPAWLNDGVALVDGAIAVRSAETGLWVLGDEQLTVDDLDRRDAERLPAIVAAEERAAGKKSAAK